MKYVATTQHAYVTVKNLNNTNWALNAKVDLLVLELHFLLFNRLLLFLFFNMLLLFLFFNRLLLFLFFNKLLLFLFFNRLFFLFLYEYPWIGD